MGSFITMVTLFFAGAKILALIAGFFLGLITLIVSLVKRHGGIGVIAFLGCIIAAWYSLLASLIIAVVVIVVLCMNLDGNGRSSGYNSGSNYARGSGRGNYTGGSRSSSGTRGTRTTRRR